MVRADEPGRAQVFNQELVAMLAQGWPVLVGGTIVVAVLAYLATFLLSAEYTSMTHLRLDRATARGMESLMTSPTLTEAARASVTPDGEAEWTVRVVDTEPLGALEAPRLFRLDVAAGSAALARQLAAKLIDLWRGTTLPGDDERERLEAELVRVEAAAVTNTALLEAMQDEGRGGLILPQSDQGEIATRISDLVDRRNAQLERAAEIRAMLAGVPEDVVVAGPSAANRPSGPNRAALTVLATLASLPVIAAGLLVVRTAGRRRQSAG